MSEMGVTDTPAGRLQALFEGHRLTPTQRRIAHSLIALTMAPGGADLLRIPRAHWAS